MAFVNSNWETHDFQVKMLDWSAARGSRLAFTCRNCKRKFCNFTVLSQGAWAADADGRALDDAVSIRWLAEKCPRLPSGGDDKDRERLRGSIPQ